VWLVQSAEQTASHRSTESSRVESPAQRTLSRRRRIIHEVARNTLALRGGLRFLSYND